MPSQLCHACRRIPASFFSPEHDDSFFSLEHDGTWFYHGPEVSLQPLNSMRRAASSGCPLCRVLIARVDHSNACSFLPLDVLERHPVRLRRAITDPHQGIGLWIDMDNISHSTFFRVPPSWGKQNCYIGLASRPRQGDLTCFQ